MSPKGILTEIQAAALHNNYFYKDIKERARYVIITFTLPDVCHTDCFTDAVSAAVALRQNDIAFDDECTPNDLFTDAVSARIIFNLRRFSCGTHRLE